MPRGCARALRGKCKREQEQRSECPGQHNYSKGTCCAASYRAAGGHTRRAQHHHGLALRFTDLERCFHHTRRQARKQQQFQVRHTRFFFK